MLIYIILSFSVITGAIGLLSYMVWKDNKATITLAKLEENDGDT